MKLPASAVYCEEEDRPPDAAALKGRLAAFAARQPSHVVQGLAEWARYPSRRRWPLGCVTAPLD